MFTLDKCPNHLIQGIISKGETFTRVNGDSSFSGSKRLQKC